MNRRDWQILEEAAALLQLEEKASIAEIKRAYHRLSKRYHPDTSSLPESVERQEKMYQLTAAYEALLAYCHEYRFPLRWEAQTDLYDPGEWWHDRFGENLFWGASGQKKKKR